MSRLAWVGCLIFLLAGCAIHRPQQPAANSIVLSWDLAIGAPAWEKEASKRFKNPVLLIVHGAAQNGEWRIFPDGSPSMSVEGTVLLLKRLYPQRPILVCSCNASGLRLKVRGVYYARKIVSSIPHLGKPEWVESVWEFEEGK